MENGTVENGVCSKESVNGSCDVWSCKDSDSSSADHLVVMVHGILGSSSDWKFGAKQFVKRLPDKVFVHCSERNMSKLTLDGVDVMGERLAQEVLEVIERKPNLRKISFVAHSVGGLVARYAIGRLYRPPKIENEDSSADTSSENSRGTIAGLEAINFITVATPHLGSRGNKQVPFLFGVTAFEKAANFVIHLIFRRTGRHLFLNDNDEGRPPLLRRMLEDEDENYFMSALRAFKRRFQFPTLWLDYNEKDVFFVKQWEDSLDEKYPHIVYHEHCKACDAEQLDPSSMEDDGSDKIEEELVKGLSRVSWEKIDVSFHNCRQRFAAHSVIQVKDEVVHMEEELVKGRSRVSWEKIDVSFHCCGQWIAAHSVIQIMIDNQGGQLEFQSLAASWWTLFDHANHAHASHAIDLPRKSFMQSRSFAMSTNKERIERVETELGGMQNEIQRLGQGMNDKFHHLEAMINKLVETFGQSQRAPHQHDQTGTSRTGQGETAGERKPIPPRVAKLDFPKYSGDDPTEWVNREANQWWQWLRRTYQEYGQAVTWNTFVDELWARFGPTWTQRALVGTFMGGLKPEISEEIRLFRPKTLKEAINLARMKDEQIVRQRKLIRPTFSNRAATTSPIVNKNSPATPFKRLTWEEMQHRRAQGLCFNCNDKFTAGHRCTKAQLLILEAEEEFEETLEAVPTEEASFDPKITFYALTGWTAPQTMRVKAKIGPYEIIVLIDSGSTHNFISTRLANLLKLLLYQQLRFLSKLQMVKNWRVK
ncbi:DUF676 domain-containing protein [Citrus sinensis]|uniref:DUF676 domain-containing protein n=1 Tax=Citrus sinensis TaxID=2711 RepID=A0ACB8HV41_CITSI|nr:DUF676 domain-containing protein [Citrus sinensis]